MTDFSRPVRPKWLGSFAGPTVIPRFAVPCNLGDLNSELCCKPSAATQKSPRTDGSSLIGLGTCSRAFGRFLIRLLLFYFFGPLLFFRPLFLVPLQASPLLLCSLFWQRFLGQRRFFIFFLVFFLVFIFIFIFTFIFFFIFIFIFILLCVFFFFFFFFFFCWLLLLLLLLLLASASP